MNALRAIAFAAAGLLALPAQGQTAPRARAPAGARHETSTVRLGSEAPSPSDAVVVGAGTYRPLFPSSPSATSMTVAPFRLDRAPVTAGEYLAFVRAHPEWRRDRVARVLADEGYLTLWESPDRLGARVAPDEPAASVSWFAARAYCAERGMRLPTEAEWEHAAAASRTRPDGDADPAWGAELLAIYSRPAQARPGPVRAGAPNFWGIYDLHGMVWEWVSDFGNAATAFGDTNARSFCGAVASGASAAGAASFPAFQRVAFRTSLRAAYTTRNLGFRCASSLPNRSNP